MDVKTKVEIRVTLEQEDQLARVMMERMQLVMNQVAVEARRIVPTLKHPDKLFHPGDLLRTIRVDTIRDGTKITVRVTAVGGAISWARFVELGTHNMRAVPYLRPGFWRLVSDPFPQRSRGKYIPI